MARRRLGPATIEVLQAIAAGHPYGFDIMDATGLPGGTVYPALAALERDGLVSSSWEDPQKAQAEKRPPRRYYTVAHQGGQALRRELERLRRLSGVVDGVDGVGAAESDLSARKA
jgi:DNA-binding PadR family transcriptional regulator